MKQPRILVTRKWPKAVERRMHGIFDVVFNTSDDPMTHGDFRAAFQSYDAVYPTISQMMHILLKICG